jgi:hypothetical protein
VHLTLGEPRLAGDRIGLFALKADHHQRRPVPKCDTNLSPVKVVLCAQVAQGTTVVGLTR